MGAAIARNISNSSVVKPLVKKKKNPKPMFAPTTPEVSQTAAMNTGYGSQGGASVKGSGISGGNVDYSGLLASKSGTLLGR